MKNMKEAILTPVLKFLTNRLLFLIVGVCIAFYILAAQLFNLQIVNGHIHQAEFSETVANPVAIKAQRGTIYDRYGRPLAVNEFAYAVTIDPSVYMGETEVDGVVYEEINEVLYNLLTLLNKHGETYLDDLPLTAEHPYEFAFYGENTEDTKIRWISQDMGLLTDSESSSEAKARQSAADMDAAQVFVRLKEKFNIPYDVPDDIARAIISIRAQMWKVRYYSYSPIKIAENVSIETVTRIEEDPEKFKSLAIEKDAVRVYPEGKYLSHVVGHVGRINADELAVFEESGNEKEYTANDTVGKAGAESVFEDKLRGTNGELTVVVNASGRKVSEIEGSQIDPVQGDKIFLTIDAEFQKQCFNILEETLKDVIIAKMTSTDPKAVKISTNELLAQLVRGNNIKSRDYFANSQGKYSDMLKAYVLSVDKNADPNTPEGRKEINEIVATGIETDAVPALNIIMVLIEQGTITADEDYIHSIENELLSPFQVVMEKLQSGEITPQMTNVDPSTGSLVVVDVKTGDILACPTYPTYDVNEYNSNYVNLSEDATLPLINRPFMEPRPPGSTFKMITAAAALENGSVTADTTIYDEVVFTKAGRPEPECMNKAGHGYVDVVHALEVSCNYYFFEAMYRLGNQKDGNELESIGDLDEYMSLFGLDEPTGVEIGELNKSRGKSNLNISSPEYKEYLYSDSDAEPTDWFDGDTAQTAMGQGFNSYTPAVMARYINTIASRGDKFDLHLLNRIETKDEILEYVPKYTSLGSAVSSDTWDLIYEGMRLVIEGPKGTGRRVFEDFPISVAGKTGTAEQFIGIRPDHTSFAGFAPFEEPEIAVYVMLPFSDTTTMSSPATQVARKVMDAYFKLETPPEVNPDINTLIP